MDKQFILEGILEAKDIKRSEDGRMRFIGLALRFNTLSANDWFYGEQMVRESVTRTNEWIAANNVSTSYATHGQALGGFGSMPTHKPLGKIESFFLEGDELRYRAMISPTEEGKDMMTLIEDGVVVHTSIRSSMFEAEPTKMSIEGEERNVMNAKWAIINGVDFCDRPGVAGAGIIKVLESAPTVVQTEDEMDIKELTLEALKSERRDLVDAAVVEHLSMFQAQLQEKDVQIESLQAEIETLKETQADPDAISALEAQIQVAEAALSESQVTVAVWEEVSVPLVRAMVELRKANPDMKVEDVRNQALAGLTEHIGDQGSGGATDEEENDSLEDVVEFDDRVDDLLANTVALSR